MSAPINAAIQAGQGIGTILDDDTPALSIGNVSITEGNSGSTNAMFTVTLTPVSGQPVTVSYATANGTATAGSDYTAVSGTLTFAAGVTTQTISVPVSGDTLPEANETFTVTLSTPVNATIQVAQAIGTILDDDTLPVLSIGNVSVTEGNSGSTNAVFTVTLSPASTSTVSVSYTTANGTATAGTDYTAKSGTLTFTAGVTTQTISVPVLGDTLLEGNETFTVTLSAPVNATIQSAQAIGTILDDDTVPTLSIGNVSVTEGNSGSTNAVFTVTLTPVSGRTVTVSYATADGTATAGADYTAVSGTLTFPAGVATQTINVPVLGDTLNEGNESFTVTVSAPVNATIQVGQAIGTILDDEPCSYLVSPLSGASAADGGSGVVQVTAPVGCTWTAASDAAWATPAASSSGSAYGAQVLADGPTGYWRQTIRLEMRRRSTVRATDIRARSTAA